MIFEVNHVGSSQSSAQRTLRKSLCSLRLDDFNAEIAEIVAEHAESRF